MEGSSGVVDNRKVSGEEEDDEEDNNDTNDNLDNMFGYIDEDGNVTYIEMESDEELEAAKEIDDGVHSDVVLHEEVQKVEPQHIIVTAPSPHHVFHKLEDENFLVTVPFDVAAEKEAALHNPSIQYEPVNTHSHPGGTESAKAPVVSLGKHFQDLREPSPRINPAIFIR